jgi:V/A-type H+-transporting ATPase subunit E
MHNKLQELTDKIYNEGVSKGNEEAERIRQEAQQEAENIIQDANKKAEDIIANAEKKSKDIESNTMSEIKMASDQALSSLKQQITEIINEQVINQPVSESVNDKKFIQELIRTLIKNWSQTGSFDFTIILPESSQQELEAFVKSEAKAALDKGLQIEYKGDIKSGFQLEAKNGGYKLNFSENDFQNFIQQFIRPRLVKFLFEKA